MGGAVLRLRGGPFHGLRQIEDLDAIALGRSVIDVVECDSDLQHVYDRCGGEADAGRGEVHIFSYRGTIVQAESG